MSAHSSGPPPLATRIIMAVLRVFLTLMAVIVVSAVVTRIAWEIKPSHEFDIFVYDQSVPNDSYPEHAVLGQLFEYHKVDYDPTTDYFGAKPGGGVYGEWPSQAPDISILADAYGVYSYDGSPTEHPVLTRRTRSLTTSQAEDIAAWAAEGVPTYGEFAMVYAPTPGSAGAVIEDVFGIKSSPWVFRYWDNLSTVTPSIKSLHDGPWTYSGPGIVLVSGPAADRPGEVDIIVLTAEDLNDTLPQIHGGAPGSIKGTASFDNWGSIVEALPGTTVDAVFEFEVNDSGREKLDMAGLEATFPALIRRNNTLYFTGNGLSNETPFRLNHLQGAATFTRLITGKEFRFLYTILEPSVGWLIENAE